MAKVVSKKRKVVVDMYGEVHINASFNNIIITLTNKYTIRAAAIKLNIIVVITMWLPLFA